ncbi:MAG: DUF2812 domain-containing protein [Firmicutes bacterium]|nr:DUF2812 domain-containing protein [Bacillota bacterium]
MEKYIFIAAVILGLIEIALYRIKDKKKRFVAMAYVGVFVMALILVGTIIAEMDGATIFMAILLVGYVFSLWFIWKRIIEKEPVDERNIIEYAFKLLQFRKEESWLNKMAEDQKALTEITLNLYGQTFYHFIPCEPGKYIYHIEYLKDENIEACISYMQGNGAEYVCKISGITKKSIKKLYFRKERESGSFDGFYDKSALYISAKKHIIAGVILGIIYLFVALPLLILLPQEPAWGIAMCIVSLAFFLIAYWGYSKKKELINIPSYKD